MASGKLFRKVRNKLGMNTKNKLLKGPSLQQQKSTPLRPIAQSQPVRTKGCCGKKS